MDDTITNMSSRSSTQHPSLTLTLRCLTKPIRPGECLIVQLEEKAGLIHENPFAYWVGVCCDLENLIPRSFLDQKPKVRPGLYIAVWLMDRPDFRWIPRPNIFNIDEGFEKAYGETHAADIFATCIWFAKEYQNNLDHWVEPIQENATLYENQHITAGLSLGPPGETSRKRQRLSFSSLEDDDSQVDASRSLSRIPPHEVTSKSSQTPQKSMRKSDAMVLKSIECAPFSPGVPSKKSKTLPDSKLSRDVMVLDKIGKANPDPGVILTLPPPPPLALTSISFKPQSHTQTEDEATKCLPYRHRGSTGPVPADSRSYSSQSSEDLVEVYIGRSNQIFKLSRAVIGASPTLSRLITSPQDRAPYIMDPRLADLDPETFRPFVVFLHTGEYIPRLVKVAEGGDEVIHTEDEVAGDSWFGNSDTYTLCSSSGGHSEKPERPPNYTNQLQRAGSLFTLSRWLDLPALATLVLKKVCHVIAPHLTTTTTTTTTTAQLHQGEKAMLQFASEIFGRTHDSSDFGWGEESGYQAKSDADATPWATMQTWVVDFLAINIQTFCSGRDNALFWAILALRDGEVEKAVLKARIRLLDAGVVRVDESGDSAVGQQSLHEKAGNEGWNVDDDGDLGVGGC